MLCVDLNSSNPKSRQYELGVDSQLPIIIESWMTSLKKHTIDYNEKIYLNVKNIPTPYTNRCGSELINNEMGISINRNNSLSVVTYRNNDQLTKYNVTTKRLCQFFNIIVNDDNNNNTDNYYDDDDLDDSRTTTSIYNTNYGKTLMNDHHHYVNCTNDKTSTILVLFNQNSCCKQFDLKTYLHNLNLSFSLNQILISYDHIFKFLINNYRVNKISVKPKKLVQKYFKLLKYIDSKNNNNNNSVCNKNSTNYFLKLSNDNYSLNYKKNLLDYEIKCGRARINNVTATNLTIDDFEIKTNRIKMKKSFNDFCLDVTNSENNNDVKKSDNKCEMVENMDKSDETNQSRVLRRDTLTKNRIKNLNVYRNARHPAVTNHLDNYDIDENDDYTSIYQPIWKYRTVGSSPDTDHTDTSMQANLAVPDDISDSDNWSNAEHDFEFQNFSFIDETDNSLEYYDAKSIDKQSDHTDNDSNNNINSNCDDKFKSSPYSKVTFFYNVNMVNNSNNNLNRIRQNINNKYYNNNTNNYNKTLKNIINSNLPKNIESWQFSLLNYNLIEDEEDVIMTEKALNETVSQDHTLKIVKDTFEGKGTSFTETKIFGFANSKSTAHIEKIAGNDSPPVGKFTPNKFADELEYNYGSIKNDPESETTSLKSLTVSLKESPKYSPTNSEKKLEKLKAKEKERKKEKDKVFGVDLDKVELDPDLGVPKFIVECIKIVEEVENIETNGIYRASGNKNNIENIKKKMNEKRYMSKESKYTFLQNQDLHTITGALKLFFRETSDLIPEEVFANLPKNLSCKENLETVKTQINTLDEVRFETLKYLMKHLRKVHENHTKNLMTSSNLSIIWGASLFTKSVNSIMSLIENDIMNRNVLIRVLIDNYDYVFNEQLFGSISISPTSINSSSSSSNSNNDNVINQR